MGIEKLDIIIRREEVRDLLFYWDGNKMVYLCLFLIRCFNLSLFLGVISVIWVDGIKYGKFFDYVDMFWYWGKIKIVGWFYLRVENMFCIVDEVNLDFYYLKVYCNYWYYFGKYFEWGLKDFEYYLCLLRMR